MAACDALQGEVEKIQPLISQAQLGRERINERLASMLGEALQITVAKDLATNKKRFKLVHKKVRSPRTRASINDLPGEIEAKEPHHWRSLMEAAQV